MVSRVLGQEPLTGQLLSHYRIAEQIGEGGMGQIYFARDEHLARDVAIKVFPPGILVDETTRKRFRQEALTLSQLNHPNIATIYDFDTQEGVDFLAMEYIHGVTLSEKLRAGPLPEKEVIYLGTQLVEGLAAAHNQGIIHRDIKPGNLRVTGDQRVKILDFGLAKLLRPISPEAPTESIAETQGTAGTLPYMAPEQLRGEALGPSTDIYAAGSVLYEMCTGKRPFQETFSPRLVDDILHQTPIPPSTLNRRVSPQLQTVILKCLEKNQDYRYATAADLLVDLRALHRSESAVSYSLPARRGRRSSKGPVIIGGVVVIALAIFLSTFSGVPHRFEKWLGILRPVPREKLVAVLPFNVGDGNTQTTPFSDGLTETLTAKLTQLTMESALQVVPAAEIRDKRVRTLDSARDEFGATIVVEGNLHRSGDHLRINIALVDARTRRQVRAESLTVAVSDPFAVQDRIVNAVVEMLELEVRPRERQELATHGTEVASAYELYLQGRGYLQNYDQQENIESAIQVFNRALQQDPSYALAYAGRGYAHWKMFEGTHDPNWIQASRQDCERALNLDNRLPAALVCLGTLDRGTGDYKKAAAEFENAIDNEPTNDQAYLQLAETYEQLGTAPRAEATYRRAINMRPRYWAGYNWLGVFYYHRAQYREAAEMFEQVVALAPDNTRGLFNLAAAYTGQGRYTDAIGVLQRSIGVRPTATAFTDLGNAYFYLRQYDQATRAYENATKLDEADILLWRNLGDGYYWTPGKRDQAAAAYQHAISLAKGNLKINPKDAHALGTLAVCYAMLGDKQRALESLREGLQLNSENPEMRFKAALVYNRFGDAPHALTWLEKALSSGFSSTTLRDTPDFDHLRGDPRFQKLLRPN